MISAAASAIISRCSEPYQASGEYSTITAATNNGWIDGDKAMRGSRIAFERPGADGRFNAMRIVDLERSRAKLACLEAA